MSLMEISKSELLRAIDDCEELEPEKGVFFAPEAEPKDDEEEEEEEEDEEDLGAEFVVV